MTIYAWVLVFKGVTDGKIWRNIFLVFKYILKVIPKRHT